MTSSAHLRRYRFVSKITAWLSILTGIMVLAGWWLHVPLLMSIVPGLVTLKPNTALCFILTGLALWLLHISEEARDRRKAQIIMARLCAVIVALIGIGSACERWFGWTLGIDELLFRQTLLATPVPRPGLMAAATGLGFFFLAAALVLLDWETPRKKRNPAHVLALAVVMIGFVSLLGYLYGVQLLFGAGGYTVLAVHTATLFVLLGTGILFVHPDRGSMAIVTSERLGGLMARRMLPILVCFSVLISWLRLRMQNGDLFTPQFAAALFTALYLIVLVLVAWICALWLNRADAARQRAEARDILLASLVESSSDAVVSMNMDGEITSWNKGAETLYGYSEKEVMGVSGRFLLAEDRVDKASSILDEIREKQAVIRMKTVRRHKEGRLIPVALTVFPMRNRNGYLLGIAKVSRDITAEKQFEQALQQSQAQLQAIIDSAMDALITIDSQQRVVMFNPAAERMFQCPAADALGSPVDRFIPARFRAVLNKHIQTFGQSTTISRAMGTRGAVKGLRANGEEFSIEASISQTISSGKKLYTAIVRDVTEREQAERALREQANMLDLAQILVRDLDGRILFWSHGAEKLYGYQREEALGRISHELFQTEFPLPLESIWEILQAKGTWEGELTHCKRDGSKIVVASVWVLERDASGAPSRILEANTDITERKHAEETLQLTQARLLSALEGGRMGTWVWEMGKNQIIWDEAMCMLFGRDPQEQAEGGSIDPFFSWIHPQDRERTREAIEAAMEKGDHYDAEYRLFRPDKSMIWIAARGRVERDAQGRAFRMTGVCVDITERKKIEEQLLQAQKMESLGTLAGGIAHDFNNILLAIGGNARLAIQDLPQDHTAQLSLQEISKASARAISLVRQILSFSRRQTPDRKPVHMQPVVEEALALLRATLPARIEIRTSFSPELPAISADSTQMHQVIMNLVTNAARAMGEQGGLLEVTLKAVTITPELAARNLKLRAGEYVRLSIRDTGTGMSPAVLERIFDPFFTTQEPGEGTGLGLSVVHGIMKDHEGAISVYSEPGKGTVFHLYFPAIAHGEERATTAMQTTPRGRGQRLLYVDDEEALVLLVTRSLGRLGYKVKGEISPLRAVEIFREDPAQFDGVITDLSMPGMSGTEFARHILEICPEMPVVMMSGYIRPEDETNARQLGVYELILKPETIDDLAQALDRLFTAAPAET